MSDAPEAVLDASTLIALALALARRLGLPAYTADRAWREVDLDVEVVLIR